MHGQVSRNVYDLVFGHMFKSPDMLQLEPEPADC